MLTLYEYQLPVEQTEKDGMIELTRQSKVQSIQARY